MDEKIDGWWQGETGKRAADSDTQWVSAEKNASMKETFLICAADESESWICNTDEGGWSDSDPRSSCFGKVFMVWSEICENDGLKNLYPNLWNT